jgi:hypothetical protein
MQQAAEQDEGSGHGRGQPGAFETPVNKGHGRKQATKQPSASFPQALVKRSAMVLADHFVGRYPGWWI